MSLFQDTSPTSLPVYRSPQLTGQLTSVLSNCAANLLQLRRARYTCGASCNECSAVSVMLLRVLKAQCWQWFIKGGGAVGAVAVVRRKETRENCSQECALGTGRRCCHTRRRQQQTEREEAGQGTPWGTSTSSHPGGASVSRQLRCAHARTGARGSSPPPAAPPRFMWEASCVARSAALPSARSICGENGCVGGVVRVG